MGRGRPRKYRDPNEISLDYGSSRGRGRPKGGKNKAGHKAGRPRKSAYHDPSDIGDLTSYQGPKRGRGRPVGTKNKAGHKAGRPKKKQVSSTSRKRKRNINLNPFGMRL